MNHITQHPQAVCGIDVHESNVVACIRQPAGEEQIKTFPTTTQQLKALRDWLQNNQVAQVAMESTGVYWKPVFNIIGDDFELLLVNARHIKNVPGRKTDIKDSQWIAQLLQAGLLKASFIPEHNIRELRKLTRYEHKLQGQLQQEKNRVQKLLQECNIKINEVLSDIFGPSGRRILKDLAQGITDTAHLASHMDRDKRLMPKKQKAREALEGLVTKESQFLLQQLLLHIDFIEQQQKALLEAIAALVVSHDEQAATLLQTIPGIGKKASQRVIAEVGTSMDSFKDHRHMAAWSGLAPGQNESAGKKKVVASLMAIAI